MKNLIAAILVVMAIVIASCNTPGQSTQHLTGNEQNLPDELKGLKVYTVATGELNTIQIAVLKGQVIATQESDGEDVQNTAIIRTGNSVNSNTITVLKSAIILENDSIIIVRK